VAQNLLGGVRDSRLGCIGVFQTAAKTILIAPRTANVKKNFRPRRGARCGAGTTKRQAGVFCAE
jgi:hypothetical protein